MAPRQRKDSEQPAAIHDAASLRDISLEESARDEIDLHVQSDTSVEKGGVLVGYVDDVTGHIVVTASIPAHRATSAVASLTFTHEAWDDVNEVMSSEYEGMRMVGWYHSHPRFGIFLSEYDVFIQKNFFSETWQVAYVVDPVLGKSGIFGWESGEIVRYPVWSVIARGASKSVREPDRGPQTALPSRSARPVSVRIEPESGSNDKRNRLLFGGLAVVVALAAGFGLGHVLAGNSTQPTVTDKPTVASAVAPSDDSGTVAVRAFGLTSGAEMLVKGMTEQWQWVPGSGVYAVTIHLASSAGPGPRNGTVTDCAPQDMLPLADMYSQQSLSDYTASNSPGPSCDLTLPNKSQGGLANGTYETFLFVSGVGPKDPATKTPTPTYDFHGGFGIKSAYESSIAPPQPSTSTTTGLSGISGTQATSGGSTTSDLSGISGTSGTSTTMTDR
jgi:proteasome lid subunit RPN8/RPN11